MDLSKLHKIYMIGVKGVGMTMLAQYLRGQGVEIFGSDVAESFMTDQVLRDCGVKLYEGFDVANIPGDMDLIIYSTAYNEKTNVELAYVLKKNIRALSFAEALASIFNANYGIAVVGSHGKTTVSAWLGFVMWKSGLSPNVMVGSRVPQFDGSALTGQSDYLVAEVDEYQNKLQHFHPQMIVVNNIDHDHHDFFPTLESYVSAFTNFFAKLSGKGILIANFDDEILRKKSASNCRGKVISYSINNATDYVAYDITGQADPSSASGYRQFFRVKLGNENETLGDFSIQMMGRHSIYNALAVIVASIELGIELRVIREHLADFRGTDRRMQILGTYRGALIIDDYAHHPTEIRSTLAGLRQSYPKDKIITVFHPHTFTRTRNLLSEFAKSFVDTDELIVLDIYGSARETRGGVSSAELVELIKKESNAPRKITHIASLTECEKYLRAELERGDKLILMGAGDIFRIGESLIGKL